MLLAESQQIEEAKFKFFNPGLHQTTDGGQILLNFVAVPLSP